MGKALPVTQVPCKGCTLCCQGDAIRLEPEDLVRSYRTEPHPYAPGALMIAHTPEGHCVYLGEHGCSIHGNAPALCRAADCRTLALRIDFDSAQRLHRMGRLDLRVWDQGHRLLALLIEERKRLRK
jgi:uncharacterized protein